MREQYRVSLWGPRGATVCVNHPRLSSDEIDKLEKFLIAYSRGPECGAATVGMKTVGEYCRHLERVLEREYPVETTNA